jgi:excinuclease UvrABC nuclease subunit
MEAVEILAYLVLATFQFLLNTYRKFKRLFQRRFSSKTGKRMYLTINIFSKFHFGHTILFAYIYIYIYHITNNHQHKLLLRLRGVMGQKVKHVGGYRDATEIHKIINIISIA